jgi:hypothetical protein
MMPGGVISGIGKLETFSHLKFDYIFFVFVSGAYISINGAVEITLEALEGGL